MNKMNGYQTDATPRPLAAIARDIKRTWPKPYFGAVPYITAMSQLDAVTDTYVSESGKSVVLYFLANASTWRGEDAQRIKKELKKLAGVK
jgi:hypothetical protein